MVKAESVATVASIAEQFRTSQAAVVTEYRGLTMKQLTALRRALGPTTEYAVAKNTFAKRAAADAGVTGLDDLLSGPTGIAFVKGEPSEAAKAIREFAKTNPLLVIKGGVLDGRALPASDVAKLADLESREVLLAKFAGALKGNLAKAAGMLTQLPAQFARLAAALAEQKAAGAPAEQAAPTEETAESAAPEAAAATVVAADVASTEPEAAETPAAEEAPAVEAAADQAPADTTPTDSDSEPAAETTPTNDDGVVNSEVQQAAAAADEAPADQA